MERTRNESTCCIVAMIHNIRSSGVSVSYSNSHIMAIVSTEFLACLLISFMYRYHIVLFFIRIKEKEYKFMVAAIAP